MAQKKRNLTSEKKPVELNLQGKPYVKGKKYRDYSKPKMITLADGTEVMERYHNDLGSMPKYPEKQGDPEAVAAPKDKAAKHRYPPPRNNPIFREKWLKFIDSVVGRESFKTAHLDSLAILCDLFAEYEDLQRVIRTEGRTYKSVSRFGETIKPRPEVILLERVKGNISTYLGKLDLFPKKDHTHEDKEDEESEWA